MLIRVTVRVNAKKESIVEKKEGVFTISVRVPAERNLANIRVREILASRFGIPIGKVRILTGHKSPKKIISVESCLSDKKRSQNVNVRV